MSIIATLIEAIQLIVRMTWETWWALVLGFTISGAVEAFVSDRRLTRVLGGDGWREAALGAAFGAASSSCSYSAVSASKTLFEKGASGVASLAAFLFASTNLVIELGLVLWVLFGWQFVVGEYVGGLIVVGVMVLSFKHLIPGRWIADARERLRETGGATCPTCGMEVDPDDPETITKRIDGTVEQFCGEACLSTYKNCSPDQSWTARLLSADGWRAAASKTITEWSMLWRDIAFGFVLAGLIGAFVSTAWWEALFSADRSVAALVASAVIAVGIGIVTFMCSVGNVPFALVLWINGLPFGGVLAFIYADLLIPPLVNLYRKYYGWRLAGALVGSLFIAAVIAGTVTHFVMGGLGLIPAQEGMAESFSGEYTTILNLLLTPVFLGQVYAAYGPERITAWLCGLPDAVREVGRAIDAGCEELLDALADASYAVGEALSLIGAGVVKLVVATWLVLRGVVSLARHLYEAGT